MLPLPLLFWPRCAPATAYLTAVLTATRTCECYPATIAASSNLGRQPHRYDELTVIAIIGLVHLLGNRATNEPNWPTVRAMRSPQVAPKVCDGYSKRT